MTNTIDRTVRFGRVDGQLSCQYRNESGTSVYSATAVHPGTGAAESVSGTITYSPSNLFDLGSIGLDATSVFNAMRLLNTAFDDVYLRFVEQLQSGPNNYGGWPIPNGRLFGASVPPATALYVYQPFGCDRVIAVSGPLPHNGDPYSNIGGINAESAPYSWSGSSSPQCDSASYSFAANFPVINQVGMPPVILNAAMSIGGSCTLSLEPVQTCPDECNPGNPIGCCTPPEGAPPFNSTEQECTAAGGLWSPTPCAGIPPQPVILTPDLERQIVEQFGV